MHNSVTMRPAAANNGNGTGENGQTAKHGIIVKIVLI